MLRWTVLLLCGVAAAAPEIRENERFKLEADATAEETDEILRLLEAANAQLVVRFKAKPGKVLVQVKEGAPGAPDGKTVVVQRQPGRYATRALLLREYVRVFYELARAKGREAETKWYREGQAEFLSGHDWDGKTLRMGVVPAVAADNLPGLALAEVKKEGFDLAPVVEGGTPASRALAWALYGHVTTGNATKPLAGFEKFEPKMAGGVKAAPLFWQCFGKAPDYAPFLARWLEGSQQPFVPIAGDWEGLAPCSAARLGRGARRLPVPARRDGVPRDRRRAEGEEGLARGRRPLPRERQRVRRLPRRLGGLLQHLQGRRRQAANPRAGPRHPAVPGTGAYKITLFRKKEQVYLMLEGGASYGPWELPGTGFGLAVENNDLTFSDVTWK